MHDHLSLPRYTGVLEKRKRNTGGGGYSFPEGRVKKDYYKEINEKVLNISRSFKELKEKYNGKINPNLIYKINVNQSVDITSFRNALEAMGGITVLSIAENRKGYWVVFSNDEDFKIFKDKLAQYAGVVEDGRKYDFFNAIDSVEDIPVEEKIGPLLTSKPLKEGEVDFFDVEIWRMEDELIESFIVELKNTYNDLSSFRICDQLITKSFALFRIKMSADILKEIVELKEVARIDRPFVPTFKLAEYSGLDIKDVQVTAPNDDSVGILVIDSGITSNHPLLEKAVGSEENFQEMERELQDKVGHGTAVAGVAIYGDIKKCVEEKNFSPSNWLFSAKIMYAQQNFNGEVEAVYDKEKLLESQLNNAIRSFLDNNTYRIKVVNLSIGNREEYLRDKHNRQFPLAALIDELAYEYKDVVFVASAGNSSPTELFNNIEELLDNYPNYLVENESFRIINPATSALSLTVGSIAQDYSIPSRFMDTHLEQLWTPIAQKDQPSPFTRVGFGLNGMLKPEVVHYGGNLILGKMPGGRIEENVGGKLPVLSNDPLGKLLAYDYGTSFSAPHVTHILGKIANKFPDKSANFIKNLLLQSTNSIKIDGLNGNKSEKANSNYKIQGYGLPSFEHAVHSFDNRVVLLDESVIGLNKVQLYSFELPSQFFETKGRKKISVVLTFDPLTRMTRGDSYLGNQMQFKLYHTVNPNLVAKKFANFDFTKDEQTVSEIDKYEIELSPGPKIRNKGCHQKGVKEFINEPKKIPKSPLTLVVINSNKWITDENHQQTYCVSVTIEHTQDIQLYTSIRTSIQQRVRVR